MKKCLIAMTQTTKIISILSSHHNYTKSVIERLKIWGFLGKQSRRSRRRQKGGRAVEFLVQFIFKLLEVYVNVEILQKASESDFLGIGVGHIKLAQPHLTLEEMDAGDSFDVSQNGGVETFLFFLLLGDEDVFGQKLFE